MRNSNNQIIIDTIIEEIEKGTDRGKVVEKYCKKFQKTARTIDTYWKTAKEQHQARHQLATKAADAAYIKAKEDAAVTAVMSAQERKEYLTKVLKGETTVKVLFFNSGEIIEHSAEPDHNAKLKALAELNKMEGDYSPLKIAQTDKDGKDLDFSKMKITFK